LFFSLTLIEVIQHTKQNRIQAKANKSNILIPLVDSVNLFHSYSPLVYCTPSIQYWNSSTTTVSLSAGLVVMLKKCPLEMSMLYSVCTSAVAFFSAFVSITTPGVYPRPVP
jgi:hypothetical protein